MGPAIGGRWFGDTHVPFDVQTDRGQAVSQIEAMEGRASYSWETDEVRRVVRRKK